MTSAHDGTGGRCKGHNSHHSLPARLILDLDEVTALQPSLPSDVAPVLEGAAATIDEAQGPGAKDIVPRVTVNIGVIQGGLKVHIVPGTCWFEADIRVPLGSAKR
jgi:succinyl-diaminopimelate desuccinylase